MEERSNIWPIVLGALALVVGVVALLMAVDAKNNTSSNEELAKSVRAEINQQVPQLQGALSAQSKAVTQGLRQAARARAAIKGNQAIDRGDLNKLSSEIKALQGDVNNLTDDVNALKNEQNKTRDTVANLTSRVDRLEVQVQQKKNK